MFCDNRIRVILLEMQATHWICSPEPWPSQPWPPWPPERVARLRPPISALRRRPARELSGTSGRWRSWSWPHICFVAARRGRDIYVVRGQGRIDFNLVAARVDSLFGNNATVLRRCQAALETSCMNSKIHTLDPRGAQVGRVFPLLSSAAVVRHTRLGPRSAVCSCAKI